jgi:hypothetical protein
MISLSLALIAGCALAGVVLLVMIVDRLAQLHTDLIEFMDGDQDDDDDDDPTPLPVTHQLPNSELATHNS